MKAAAALSCLHHLLLYKYVDYYWTDSVVNTNLLDKDQP